MRLHTASRRTRRRPFVRVAHGAVVSLLVGGAAAAQASPLEQRVTAGDAAASAGTAVAVDGDTMVAGAPFGDVGTSADQGAVDAFFAPAPTGPTAPTGGGTGGGGSTAAPSGSFPGAPAPGPVQGGPAPTAADGPPVLSGLRVSPRVLHRRSPHAAITYSLSKTADVVLDLARATKRCGTAKRRCATRFTILLTFAATGVTGSNRVALPTQLARSARLKTGAYRLIATPTDGSGTHGRPATARLRMTGR
ncbi:MAG TPA: hypothetical protein VHR88_09240 [Solirubrobacteraceae bacterium]|jgi:hypothetical protein|nr:hypothetical protein [Solirubrobacteraceae bacterium]